MVPLVKPVPLPEPETKISLEDRRLWIGNLDPRINECSVNIKVNNIFFSFYGYQLLKITQKYGAIEKFDLLFHKSGPLAGQPRGYAFVTFKEKENAEFMKNDLDGKKIGSKSVSVKWAHSMDKVDIAKPKIEAVIPALGVKVERKISPNLQIKAIEAKLKMMEHTAEEFEISNVPSTSSTVPSLVAKKPNIVGNISSKKPRNSRLHPYSKRPH